MKMKKIQACAICGINSATTKDHIPPKNLYAKPIDNSFNLNTVPACATCNNGSSNDDEIFKIIIGIDTGEYQDSPEKIINSLAGTIGNNNKIARNLFTNTQDINLNNNNTIEQWKAISFDGEPYFNVVKRIVRGLHYMETGNALDATASIRILPGNQQEESIAISFMDLLMRCEVKKINKDTFVYRWHQFEDGKQLWGMQFFGAHTVFAIVTPSSQSPSEDLID